MPLSVTNTDPSTPIGMIRLLITDLNPDKALFTDPQLAALLAAERGNVKRAAASALETIARSEVLIAKKINTNDLTTDGPAVARELRASAEALREQADLDDDQADGPWGLTVVDYDPYAAYRRR